MTTTKERPKIRPAQRSSSVDPRMQARRDEVVEDANRRQRRTILALVVVTIAAIGSMFFVQSSWLDVDQIAINGAVHSDIFAVRDAAGLELGEPLLELDLDQAADNVRQLPWVESAWVERRMTGNLVIHIEERVAQAAIPTAEAVVLIDASGRQLEVVDQRPEGFMDIAGIEATGVVGTPAPPAAQGAMHLISALPPELADRIQGVYFEGEDLRLELLEGGHVRLGSDSGLTEKMVSLETMLSRVDLRCLWEIDLRVPSAPALTRVSADGEVGASLTNLLDCS